MLKYTECCSCFTYLYTILKKYKIKDPVGGAYWHMRKHFKHLKDDKIPHLIKNHKWVYSHLVLTKKNRVIYRVLLEKEKVKNIAEWCELRFVNSFKNHFIKVKNIELKFHLKKEIESEIRQSNI